MVIWTDTKGPIKISRPSAPWLIKNLAYLEVFDNATANTKNCLSDQPFYNGSVSIKIRGRSTRFIQKHQFGMYTYGHITPQQEALAKQGDLPVKVEVPLLGFTKGDNWVLNAPWFDQSFLRNVIGYKMATEGSRTWQPSAKFFELFLVTDGQNKIDRVLDYQGLYVLIEKIKQDGGRVDIDVMKPTDVNTPYVTGGYIVAKDQPESDDISFPSIVGQLIVKTPDPEKISAPQQTYLEKALTHISNGFDGFQCPEFGIRFNKCSSSQRIPLDLLDVIDMNSFVDYFLHSEVVKNQDAYSNSRYFNKHRDSFEGLFGKWYSGPVWDLNLCFAASNIQNYKSVENWLYMSLSAIYQRLMKRDDFVDLVVERWFTLRDDVWQTTRLTAFFNEQKNLIVNSGAVERDLQSWFAGLDKMFQFEISANELLEFLKQRMQWLDNNICQLYSSTPQECFSDTDCAGQVFGTTKCLCNKCRSIQLQIVEPTKISNWTVGKKETIRWASSVPTAPIMPLVSIWLDREVEYSVDSPFFIDGQFLVANQTKNDQKNTWVVDSLIPAGKGYKICIYPGGLSRPVPEHNLGCSPTFAIYKSSEHFLNIIYPNQASAWTANTDQEIHWTTHGLFKYVELFYQKEPSENEIKFLSNIENDGKTSWNIPGGLSAGTYSIIVREQFTENEVNTQTFSKSPAFQINGWTRPSGHSTIIITVPSQGAYPAGNNLAIRWKFSPDTTTIGVNVYLQEGDNVGSRILIRADTKNDGKTTVFVPLTFHDSTDTGIKYRVVVQDSGSPPVEGVGELIDLRNPTRVLTITWPTTDQMLHVGSEQTIRWEATGFTNDVSLFYSDSDSSEAILVPIKENTNNDGQTTWSIPSTLPLGESYYIHIKDPTPYSTASATSGPYILSTKSPTTSPTTSPPTATKAKTSAPTTPYKEEWIDCAEGGEDCICTEVVRSYAGDGYTDELPAVNGKTKCNADKCACEVTIWVYCAGESETCSCFGPVRYGSNDGGWSYASSLNTIGCSNDNFGYAFNDNNPRNCLCGGEEPQQSLNSDGKNNSSSLVPIIIAAVVVVIIIVIGALVYIKCISNRKMTRPMHMGTIQEKLLTAHPDKVTDPVRYTGQY